LSRPLSSDEESTHGFFRAASHGLIWSANNSHSYVRHRKYEE
jgi:hypothetical protein